MTGKTYTDYLSIIRSHQEEAPVKIIPLANELGIKVYTTESWEPDGLSGAIIKDSDMGGKSGYATFVNANHPETRRRFTVAHEIAHFILHKDLIGDGIFEDALWRGRLSDKIEVEANKLAARILMPSHLIKDLMEQGHDTVPKLAKKLNVSKSAMAIKLGVPAE